MSSDDDRQGQVSDAESLADAGEIESDHYTIGRRTTPGKGDETEDSHGAGAEPADQPGDDSADR